jgi:TfoX/Sxy family transcriptional regulator of competence genes
MSYDERIADRIRAVLARRRDVVERKMFGGLTFMVNGAMCCGVTAEALVIRVGPAAYEAALAEPHARPMTFTGRPLAGMVYVDPPGYRTARQLARWVERGIEFVTAPPGRSRRGGGSSRRVAKGREGRPASSARPGRRHG